MASGTATITVTATDDGGLTDAVSFDVEVPANDGPTVNGAIPDQEFDQGVAITPLDVSGIFSDPDGDDLEFSVDLLPDGLVLDPDTGEISGIPTTLETVTVTVAATDVDASNTTIEADPFDVDIIAPVLPNAPPDAIAGTDISLTQGQIGVSIDITALFTDPEGDVLEYAVDQLPDGLVLDEETGEISGTPTTEETVLVTVSATDILGSGITVDSLPPFEIDVTAAAPVVNLAPEFNGTLLDFTITLATPIIPVDFSGFFTDPESDTLTFSVDQLPDGLALDSMTGILSGTPTTAETVDVVLSATDVAGSGLTVDADDDFEIEVES